MKTITIDRTVSRLVFPPELVAAEARREYLHAEHLKAAEECQRLRAQGKRQPVRVPWLRIEANGTEEPTAQYLIGKPETVALSELAPKIQQEIRNRFAKLPT